MLQNDERAKHAVPTFVYAESKDSVLVKWCDSTLARVNKGPQLHEMGHMNAISIMR